MEYGQYSSQDMLCVCRYHFCLYNFLDGDRDLEDVGTILVHHHSPAWKSDDRTNSR